MVRPPHKLLSVLLRDFSVFIFLTLLADFNDHTKFDQGLHPMDRITYYIAHAPLFFYFNDFTLINKFTAFFVVLIEKHFQIARFL